MEANAQTDDRDLTAARAMQSLYAGLEAILKRHQPQDYAIFAAKKLAEAFENKASLAHFRPHHMLHSIEANCAYSRGQNHDRVDFNRLARVMNVYFNHEDP
jgi:hypothetical protein